MTELSGAGSRSARRVAVGAILVAFIALCIANIVRELRRPAMVDVLEPLPTPDLTACDRQVKQMIDQARAAVDAAPSNATLNRHLGMVYHAQKLVGEAALCYRRATTLAADDFESYYYLALIDEANGELAAAIESAEQALALRPASAPALTLLGRLYWTAGRIPETQAMTRRLLEGHPQVAAGHFYSGRLLAERGALVKAVSAFETALRYAVENAQVHYALAMALRKTGEPARAEQHLRLYERGKRTSLCPDPHRERLNRLSAGANHEYERGLQLAREGRLVEAVRHYRQALRIDPELAQAHQNLGVILLKSGQLQEAVQRLSQAVRIDPTLVPAQINLGTALAKTGENDKAREAFERARELAPQNPAVFNDYANFLLSIDDVEGAIERYRIAIRLAPPDLPPRINLGLALQNAGRPGQAVQVYLEALTDHPDHLQLIDLLARAWSEAGQPEKAVEHLDASIARIGQNLALQYSLGHVLAHIPGNDAVLARFVESASVQPQAGVALVVGAQEALTGQKQYRAAIDLLRRALEVLPAEVEFMHRLAWLLSAVPDEALRNGAEALVLAQEACRITQERFPPALAALAVANAEAGRFEDAIQVAQRCLALATDANPAAIQEIQHLVERFSAHRPFRLDSPGD